MTTTTTPNKTVTQLFNLGSMPIPVWSMGYIFNADPTGLNDNEVEMVDRFINEINQLSEDGITSIDCGEDVDSDKYFSICEWDGLGTDLVDVELYGMRTKISQKVTFTDGTREQYFGDDLEDILYQVESQLHELDRLLQAIITIGAKMFVLSFDPDTKTIAYSLTLKEGTHKCSSEQVRAILATL